METPANSNFSTDPVLSLRLLGDAVKDGSIPLGRFSRFAEALDRAIRRLGQNILTSSFPQATSEERVGALAGCELRLGATKRGSYALECLRPPTTSSMGSEIAGMAVESLIDGVEALTAGDRALPAAFDDDVAQACEVMGRVFKHGVERVEFASGVRNRNRAATYDPSSLANLKARRSAQRFVAREVVGRLQMADLDRARRRCRIAPQVGEPVECAYSVESESTVVTHLCAFVRVLGVAKAIGGVPSKGRLRIDVIEPLFTAEGARPGGSGIYAPGVSPRSGVLRPAAAVPVQESARDLWTDDADFEAFLAAVRSARNDPSSPAARSERRMDRGVRRFEAIAGLRLPRVQHLAADGAE